MTLRSFLLAALSIFALPPAAEAWNRPRAVESADLPHPLRNPEGITVDRRTGEFYVADFDYKATSGTGRIAVFDRSGRLLRILKLDSSPALLGLDFHPTTHELLVIDFGGKQVLRVDPLTGASAPFAEPPPPFKPDSGLNALIIDADDNLWVVANQADEIVVVDPSGKGIAKLGDFDGIAPDGSPRGLLFPASPVFFGEFVYVTNLALDLRDFNPQFNAVDSQWTAEVTTWNVARISRHLPPVHDREGHVLTK